MHVNFIIKLSGLIENLIMQNSNYHISKLLHYYTVYITTVQKQGDVA